MIFYLSPGLSQKPQKRAKSQKEKVYLSYSNCDKVEKDLYLGSEDLSSVTRYTCVTRTFPRIPYRIETSNSITLPTAFSTGGCFPIFFLNLEL